MLNAKVPFRCICLCLLVMGLENVVGDDAARAGIHWLVLCSTDGGGNINNSSGVEYRVSMLYPNWNNSSGVECRVSNVVSLFLPLSISDKMHNLVCVLELNLSSPLSPISV